MNLYSHSQSLEERVHSLVAWTFVVEESQIKDDTHLIKDLGADSMDLIELVMTVNETFGIELDTTHLERMMRVSGLVRVIREAMPVQTS